MAFRPLKSIRTVGSHQLLGRRGLSGGSRSLTSWPSTAVRAPPRLGLAAPRPLQRRVASSAAAPAGKPALLFQLTGQDRTGVIADYADILATHGAKLLDIEQASCDTHSTFTLNFLISSPDGTSDAIICEMLQKTQEQNISMNVVVVEPGKIRGDDQPQRRHALTLMKEDLGFDVVAKVSAAASSANFNVMQVDRLSPLVPSELDKPSLTAIEFILEETATTSLENFKKAMADVQDELQCDRALQREGSLRRNKRLVVMDMDSTLIVNEVIDEIARINGCYEQVAEVTERAMNGELDFNESLVERVKCLKGAPESVFDDVYNVIELTPGAEEFVWALQTMGYKIAVVSGGFNQITNRVKKDMGIDYAFANQLEVIDGVLTGRTIGPIVNRERKRDLLESMAQTLNIEMEQVIAIGDGANDLAMIDAAGLGVAFCAKPNVQSELDHWSTINTHRLDAVLYFLGIRPKDLPEKLPHFKPRGLVRPTKK